LITLEEEELSSSKEIRYLAQVWGVHFESFSNECDLKDCGKPLNSSVLVTQNVFGKNCQANTGFLNLTTRFLFGQNERVEASDSNTRTHTHTHGTFRNYLKSHTDIAWPRRPFTV